MKSHEAKRREACRLIAGAAMVVVVLLLLLAVVETSMDWPTVVAFLQAAILLGTAGIVWWYTKETQLLRVTAEQQVIETQRQTEVQQRPFIIVEPRVYHDSLVGFTVRNMGNGAAVKIRIVLEGLEGNPTLIPALPAGESVSGQVESNSLSQAVLIHQARRVVGNSLQDNTAFSIPMMPLAEGFQLNIGYQNVAMDLYKTIEEILPRGEGYEILRSGKCTPSDT